MNLVFFTNISTLPCWICATSLYACIKRLVCHGSCYIHAYLLWARFTENSTPSDSAMLSEDEDEEGHHVQKPK